MKNKTCAGCGESYEQRHEKDYRCEKCYSKQGRRISRRGKANEDMFAKKLQDELDKKFGSGLYRIKRTPSSGAMHLDWPADITILRAPQHSALKSLHIDVKVADNWSPEKWYNEEKELCRATGSIFSKVIIVMRRPKESGQLALISWEDLKNLLIEIEGYRNQDEQ